MEKSQEDTFEQLKEIAESIKIDIQSVTNKCKLKMYRNDRENMLKKLIVDLVVRMSELCAPEEVANIVEKLIP